MTTDIAKITNNNPTELNKLFGFSGNKPKPQIPVLKINGTDDGDGTTAPKGTFVYDNGENVLYASEVTIRAYNKSYQYRIFDSNNAANNDNSIIANNFRAEFRSTSGRIACGKMPKKSYIELGDTATPQQKYFQDTVKCKLIVFGVVSGSFTNLDTKETVEVKDQLFTWVTSQSSFMIIDQTITGIEKERRAVPMTPIKLTLKKEKQGSVTYFTPVPNVQNDSVELDATRDGDFLIKINGFIKDTNDYVNSKYNEAIKNSANNKDFGSLGEILEKSDTPNDPLAF